MEERQATSQALRPTPGGVASIQLADEISRLRKRLESSEEDRLAASLVKDHGLNVMLMLLKRARVSTAPDSSFYGTSVRVFICSGDWDCCSALLITGAVVNFPI